MSRALLACQTRLLQADAVAAIVARKIYNQVAKQDESEPYITLQLISSQAFGTHDLAHDGAPRAPDSALAILKSQRIQCDLVSKTSKELERLSAAVRAALSGFKGAVAVNGDLIDIEGIIAQGENHRFISDSGVGLRVASIDFQVYISEV